MSTLVTTLTESLRYRGREGQLSFLGHRLAGLGTLLFLAIHILDTSTVYLFPNLYSHAIDIYRSTPFMLGEILLVAAVVFHGANGLKIIVYDLAPHLWEKQTERRSFWRVLVLTVVLWAPAAYFMGRALYLNNICQCPPAESATAGLVAIAPWAIAGAMVLVAVVLFAGAPIAAPATPLARQMEAPRKSLEAWAWQFMRWSGALLIPLVWLHVVLQDVLVGVHAIDLNYATLRLAMTGWKVYDILLLAFAFGHGMNGLRGIVDDYAHDPRWNRALKWAMLAGFLAITAIGAINIIAVTGA
ncbi:MAG: succinate dehydrogenase, cytochrome b556 subunit [Chloroflexi bacterium]|nr:succinate dehydrogenase, cytochrome b556 subunit [Chloroflexota bacterium]